MGKEEKRSSVDQRDVGASRDHHALSMPDISVTISWGDARDMCYFWVSSSSLHSNEWYALLRVNSYQDFFVPTDEDHPLTAVIRVLAYLPARLNLDFVETLNDVDNVNGLTFVAYHIFYSKSVLFYTPGRKQLRHLIG